MGWADWLARRDSAESLQQALRWTPGQAAYHVRLSLLTREREPLERAVALNPADAAAWIELGLESEAAGDPQAAERYLLRAADVDHQYLPRWTLANFYFRRQNLAKFWVWAAAAAERVSGDPTPLFRLCGQVTEDGELIARLRIDQPMVRLQYLLYLMQNNRMDLVLPAVHKVLDSRREIDVPTTLVACDRLLVEKRANAAIEIWNRLAGERRIPFGAVSRNSPVITNGDFATPPGSHGFDWWLPTRPCAAQSLEEHPPGLRLTFSGEQPESCELLSQFVLVREQAAYQLKFLYRTPGIPRDSGLQWRVWDGETGALLAEGSRLSSEDDQPSAVDFRTPPACRMARIALQYNRAKGTTRITGDLVLRAVEIRPR